jgi:hypothetical protein
MCIPIRGIVVSTFLALLTAESIAQSVSYPLDIGSRWGWARYLNTLSYPVEIERDTLLPNGHRYAIVPSYWSMPERWERTEGMRVYRYERGAGQEWLLFDFSKSPGDTINRSPFVVMLAARMDTLFGATRQTWEFSVGGTPGGIDAGAGAGYIITDSIGLTDYSDWNSWLRVIGAIIGSRRYGTITNIASSPGETPTRIQLDQNYPNPFNPTTTIGYALPNRAHVTLSVFNTLGQQVAPLVNEVQEAGYHEAKFDGTGRASGMYFYRLRAGDYFATKKLVLLK